MKIIRIVPSASLPIFHQTALQDCSSLYGNPEEPFGKTYVKSHLAIKELFSYYLLLMY